MFKMIKKQTIICLLLFICISTIKAQNVKDLNFYQDGNSIKVEYTLNLPEGKIANVELFVSTDGGKTLKGPLKHVTGDVGELTEGGQKTIQWKVFDEFEKLEGDISFQVKVSMRNIPIKKEKFIAYNISGSSALGLTYGVVGQWGYYARLKSNGSFSSGDYTTNDQKLTDYSGEGYYIYTDKTKHSRFAITAGFTKKVFRNAYVYGGAGYGYRNLLWNAEEFSYLDDSKISDIWAKYEDSSKSGAEIELGMIYRIKRINISAGVNTIGFGYIELNAGIGLFF